jgi:acyl-CoA synthetase (AMP-forming)/AMP-acid ligase II
MPGPRDRLAQLSSHISAARCDRHNRHHLSPTHFLPRAAEIEPAAIAVHHTGADGISFRRSYAELARRASGLAYHLRHNAFERVGILCPNTPAFLESLFAIGAAAGVSVGINSRLSVDDIAFILVQSEVDLVVVDRELVPLLDEFRRLRPSIKFLIDEDRGVGIGDYEDAIASGIALDDSQGARGWAGLEAQADDEDDMIALAYTSGTTSRPKGVTYTHRGVYLAALANVVESGLNMATARCGYLWTLPMFHATGWTFPWAVTAARGTHYCLRTIDHAHIWQLLSHEPISNFCAAPTVNTLLCASPAARRLERPVRVTVAASPPSAHLLQQMEQLNLLPVHVYGLTETYGPITKGYFIPQWAQLPPGERYEKMARQGHGFLTALPLRVVKPAAAGRGEFIDVERNGLEIGEVICFGNICAKEYYKDPEATRKMFLGGGLHSGDLAVHHEDGSVQIVDRAKDIIISGGENISSVALEALLVQHDAVLEAAVVAVEDAQWGERPMAFVTLKEGAQLRPADLIAWARGRRSISRFMVPREVAVVRELPKTGTGKLQKNVLRSWAKGTKRSSSASPSHDDCPPSHDDCPSES